MHPIHTQHSKLKLLPNCLKNCLTQNVSKMSQKMSHSKCLKMSESLLASLEPQFVSVLRIDATRFARKVFEW